MKTMFSLLLAALLAAPIAAIADTARCGSKLVSTGDSKSAVRMKCGEPESRDHDGTTCSWGIGGGSCRSVEVWTYNPGAGRFLQLLIFDGSTLAAVKTGERSSE